MKSPFDVDRPPTFQCHDLNNLTVIRTPIITTSQYCLYYFDLALRKLTIKGKLSWKIAF